MLMTHYLGNLLFTLYNNDICAPLINCKALFYDDIFYVYA